ncbi:unnamed protein product, partial [Musa banksii]
AEDQWSLRRFPSNPRVLPALANTRRLLSSLLSSSSSHSFSFCRFGAQRGLRRWRVRSADQRVEEVDELIDSVGTFIFASEGHLPFRFLAFYRNHLQNLSF